LYHPSMDAGFDYGRGEEKEVTSTQPRNGEAAAYCLGAIRTAASPARLHGFQSG